MVKNVFSSNILLQRSIIEFITNRKTSTSRGRPTTTISRPSHIKDLDLKRPILAVKSIFLKKWRRWGKNKILNLSKQFLNLCKAQLTKFYKLASLSVGRTLISRWLGQENENVVGLPLLVEVLQLIPD